MCFTASEMLVPAANATTAKAPSKPGIPVALAPDTALAVSMGPILDVMAFAGSATIYMSTPSVP